MLTSQRHLFSLPEGEHYLNTAYLSPLARPVEEAGIAALLRRRDPTSIRAADFFTDADRARALFARLVNAPDPSRVALIPAVSYGMATVAKNLSLRRGQNVVVAHAQFPSNVYPWRRLCAETGAEMRAVAPPAGSPRRGEEWNARLLEAIDGDTGAGRAGQRALGGRHPLRPGAHRRAGAGGGGDVRHRRARSRWAPCPSTCSAFSPTCWSAPRTRR